MCRSVTVKRLAGLNVDSDLSIILMNSNNCYMISELLYNHYGLDTIIFSIPYKALLLQNIMKLNIHANVAFDKMTELT